VVTSFLRCLASPPDQAFFSPTHPFECSSRTGVLLWSRPTGRLEAVTLSLGASFLWSGLTCFGRHFGILEPRDFFLLGSGPSKLRKLLCFQTIICLQKIFFFPPILFPMRVSMVCLVAFSNFPGSPLCWVVLTRFFLIVYFRVSCCFSVTPPPPGFLVHST